MWSLPTDWEFSINGLAQICADGPDAIRSALIELGGHGFINRVRVRTESGTLAGMDYQMWEKPTLENPTQVNPAQETTNREITNAIDNIELGEGVTKRGRAKRFSIPAVSEVEAYCAERKNQVNPQAFVNFYASKGWMIGKNPMKDWKASVRYWEQLNGVRAAAPQQRVGNPVEYDV